MKTLEKTPHLQVLLVCILVVMPVRAETFYVDGLDGLDDNIVRDGKSLPQAFKTIEYASANAQAGDLVIVMSGVYSQIDWKDGVTYLARGRAIVTQPDVFARGFGTVIDGFEFRSSDFAFLNATGPPMESLTVRNSRFFGSGGFKGRMINCRIERCLFDGLDTGILVPNVSTTYLSNTQIDRCTFANIGNVAISSLNTTARRIIISNSIFFNSYVGFETVNNGTSGLNLHTIHNSLFFNNTTDVLGSSNNVTVVNSFIGTAPSGSNRPAFDPNFLDPARGLYFLKATLTDGVTPNPLINGGTFIPEENRIAHIGAFGAGALAERNPTLPGADDFSEWSVKAGEPGTGGDFQPITSNPDATSPVEFDGDNNLRLKNGILVATVRSNVMDLQSVLPFLNFEVVGVHYVSLEEQLAFPASSRRVIDHNRVDDGAGGVVPDRRRTIRIRGSELSPDDVLAQSFVEINNMERLGNLGFRYVQLELVLRRDGT